MRIAALASALLFVGLAFAQAPAGWKGVGEQAYSPVDLKPGETLTATFLPSATTEGGSLRDWLLAAAEKDLGGPAPRILNDNGRAAVAAAQKGELSYLYTASSPNGKTVRWMRIVMSGGAAMTRYRPGILSLSARLASPNAVVTSEGAKAVPGKPRLGGPIPEGVYVGTQFYGTKPRLKMRLELYEDGEYRIVYPGKEERDEDGRYRYDSEKGILDVSRLAWLNTNRQDPKDALCFFARDAQGHPFIWFAGNIMPKDRK